MANQLPNRYSVAPLGGLDVGTKLENIIAGGKQQYRMKQWQETAPDIIKSGDPDAIAALMIKYPEKKEEIGSIAGYKQKHLDDDLVNTARNILINGVDPKKALGQHVQNVQQAQDDPTKPLTALGKTIQNPLHGKQWAEKVLSLLDSEGYQNYKKATSVGAGMEVAGIKEFEYLTEGLPEEEKSAARRIKLGLLPRASEEAVSKAEKAFAVESAKLGARYNLEPKVAGAVAAAKNQSKVEADAIVKGESNATAWNVYDNAMRNLEMAMKGTSTGPIVGLVPALTTEQQTADGAVAIMAPVLKQMFRASGEGVFTDKDQEMLIKMMPTRRDTPEAAAAKIKAVDMVVRAKLGMSLVEGQGTGLPEGVTEEQIQATMQKYGHTHEQVLSNIKKGGK